MTNITEEKPVWVVWTNTDLTEGRGRQIAIAAAWSKTTALRVSRKRGVQGSDASVDLMVAVRIDACGCWLAPCNILSPSKEDEDTDKQRDAKYAAIKRMQELGVTPEELSALLAVLKEG